MAVESNGHVDGPYVEPYIRALNATPGGLLQTLSGNKTRSIGYTGAQPGALVFLQVTDQPGLRVPVFIESVEHQRSVASMSEEEAHQAGFSSIDAMQKRLLSSVYPAHDIAHAPDRLAGSSNQNWLETTKLTHITYHLATEKELIDANLRPQAIKSELRTTVEAINHGSHETVGIAEARFGEHAFKAAVDRGINSVARGLESHRS